MEERAKTKSEQGRRNSVWGNGISSGETRGLEALNGWRAASFGPLNPKTGGGLNPLGVMQQMDRQMGWIFVRARKGGAWECVGVRGSVRGQISQIEVMDVHVKAGGAMLGAACWTEPRDAVTRMH